jgi:DNA polymerase-3 subunit gamma/tau
MTSYRGAPDDAELERVLAGRSVDGRPDLEPLTTLVRTLPASTPTPRRPRASSPPCSPTASTRPTPPLPRTTCRTGQRRCRPAPAPAAPITRLAGLSLAAKVPAWAAASPPLPGHVGSPARESAGPGAGRRQRCRRGGDALRGAVRRPGAAPAPSPGTCRPPSPGTNEARPSPPRPPSLAARTDARTDAPGLTCEPEQAPVAVRASVRAPRAHGAAGAGAADEGPSRARTHGRRPPPAVPGPRCPPQQAPDRATEQLAGAARTRRGEGSGAAGAAGAGTPSPAAPRAATTTAPQSVGAAGSEDAPARR